MNDTCYVTRVTVVISGRSRPSRNVLVEKPGVIAQDPAKADVDHQFVEDFFYEAGDNWAPPTPLPLKSAAKLVPASKDEGSSVFINIFTTLCCF